MSTRPVYLISFPALRGDSHWAFFLPHTPSNTSVGKYFNAVSTPFTGFVVEIEADKDLSRTNPHTKMLLGYVSVEDSVLENLANQTTPPGMSPAPLEKVGSEGVGDADRCG
ncbi:hypothetical protein K440DRAFT_622456 [Wilcoxina mikolae CBS 423.85]|nr:hypothetical protein K440DRAFT_622456 [Wilcoxina mikolae CBS 423.85]